MWFYLSFITSNPGHYSFGSYNKYLFFFLNQYSCIFQYKFYSVQFLISVGFYSQKDPPLINLRVPALQNILASIHLSTVLLYLPVNWSLIISSLILAVFPDHSVEIYIQVVPLSLVETTY